jgi:hypothetical protein
LIRHHAKLRPLCAKGQHGAQKILAHGREDPSRAQNDAARIGRLRRPFPRELGAAIGAEWIGQIAFQIRRALQTVKNIIGGNLDDGDARLTREAPQ